MADRTWPHLISALLRGEELATADTAWAMAEIMAGDATPAQIAAFAVALRAKGETAGEIAGLAQTMLAKAVRVELPAAVVADAVDVVGTGGDRAHTVNISTMAAIVVAGAGVRVIKHGNRAASSACGAADLLEYLGVPIDLSAAGVARCVQEVGIGFCFAAAFHPSYRHVGAPRREIGVPTAFNFLGPLTNPAQPPAASVGCADARMAGVLAGVFADRGQTVLIARGEDGLDEFTTAAPTRVWAVSDGRVAELLVDAADLGIARSAPGDLRGADAPFNADVAHRVLAGEPGPVRDAVVLNAAAALAAHGGFGGDVPGAVKAGLDRAAAAIDSGAAAQLLSRWVEVARSIRAAE